MKKKFYIFISVFILGMISLVPVQAKETEIHDMSISVDIDDFGNAYIQEIWDMSVYEGTEVYKVLDHMEESKVSQLKVRDDTGKVYQTLKDWDVDWEFDEKVGKCGIVQDGDRYELCFGIGEYGERTYTFEYQVSHFIKKYDDIQGFQYAFFSEMSLDIENISVTISSPYDFDENNSQIWAFGYQGKVYYQDGNIVLENDAPIGEDGKVQLLMRIESLMFQNTFDNKGSFQKILDEALDGSEYDESLYRQDGYYTAFAYKSYGELIAIIACGCVGFGVLLAAVYVSYDRTVKKMTHYRFDDHQDYQDDGGIYQEIPCHGSLFEIYYLAKKGEIIYDFQKDGLISAILLQWMRDCVITFDKKEEKQFFFFQQEGIEVDFTKTKTCQHPLEQKLFELFVEASGENKKLETHEFEEWYGRHHNDLEKWFESIDEYMENEYRSQGLLYTEEVQGKWLGKTLIRKRDVFSSSLREDMYKIAGFKRYLEDDQEKMEMNQENGETYMIYAQLLDAFDKFEEQMKIYYPHHYQNSYLLYSSHMIHTMSHQAMNASQSSVSGGGSSFSGGGGGGVR